MTKPITDALLDQLQDELQSLAIQKRSEARAACEDDDAKLDNELAELVDYIAFDRGLLVRFAYLLRSNATRHGALSQITGN